jgi:hypothetical protein
MQCWPVSRKIKPCEKAPEKEDERLKKAGKRGESTLPTVVSPDEDSKDQRCITEKNTRHDQIDQR